MSTTTATPVHAGDQIKGTGNYNAIRIANVFSSSELNHNDAGNILNDDQNTKWESKGMQEHITLELGEVSRIYRMDIEWDATLPRTGRYSIMTSDFDQYSHDMFGGQVIASQNMNGAMFAVVEIPEGIDAKYVRIECGGQNDSDMNGITCVKLYGGKRGENISNQASVEAVPNTVTVEQDKDMDSILKDMDEQSSIDEQVIEKAVGKVVDGSKKIFKGKLGGSAGGSISKDES